MMSDALTEFGDDVSDSWLEVLAFGCLSPRHAGQFKAFVRQVRSEYRLSAILKGDKGWPRDPGSRDVLYFLAQSFRAQLIKELPAEKIGLGGDRSALPHRAKALLKDLASISLEIAQLVVARDDDGTALPGWFLSEVVRDLPRLVERKSVA